MKIGFSGVVITATLFVAFALTAAPIDGIRASRIARAWSRQKNLPGQRIGREVERTHQFALTNGASFFAVKMKGGGMIFTSSDDATQPIVAFTSSTNAIESLTSESPLYKLLARDAEVRANILKAKVASGAALAASAPRITEVDAPTTADFEIRRAPLLTTRWSQTTHNDKVTEGQEYYKLEETEPGVTNWVKHVGTGINCYNYYTPECLGAYYDSTGGVVYVEENAPCGCSATAISQVMNYFKYPTQAIETRLYPCSVDGNYQLLATQGGLYDWANMINVPKDGITDLQAQAIGKLTSDVGIVLQSDYTADSTGALPENFANAFLDLAYSNAIQYDGSDAMEEAYGGNGRVTSNVGLHIAENRRNIIYSNLDNGRPVVLGIYGYAVGHVGEADYWAGHAVVGDGYAFLSQTNDVGEVTNQIEYVHINMGWSGADDAWYNLPEINASETGAKAGDSGYEFTVLSTAIYNIFTEEAAGEIISGRTLDEKGELLTNVTVTCGAQTMVTGDDGVWSFIVPSETSATVSVADWTDNYIGSITVKTGTSKDGKKIGNVWGNDITMSRSPYAGSVMVGYTGGEFGSLDAAFRNSSDGRCTVITTTCVHSVSGWVVDRNATVFSAAPRLVMMPQGATIRVTKGATLTLNDLQFMGEQYSVQTNINPNGNLGQLDVRYLTNILVRCALEPIVVDEGSHIKVAGDVRLPTLTLGGDDGFILGGAITTNLVLNTPSFERKAKVGTYTCDYATAVEMAKFLVNPQDPYMTAQPDASTGELRWQLTAVSDADWRGTLTVTQGGESETLRYSNFDRLLEDATEGDVVIGVPDKVQSFSRRIGVTNRTFKVYSTTRGGNIRIFKDLPAGAGFDVGPGGQLEIDLIRFQSYEGRPFLYVNGADASVVLSNANFRSIVGNDGYGAIRVEAGEVTMLGTTEMTKCLAKGDGYGNGGAVYLKGADATLNLFGAKIHECQATGSGNGGGIYVGKGASVNMKGDVRVKDNYKSATADDIFVYQAKNGKGNLNLVGELTATDSIADSIGIKYNTSYKAGDFGNQPGKCFLTYTCTAEAATNSLAAFCNDADSTKQSTGPSFSTTVANAFSWQTVLEKGPDTEYDASKHTSKATVSNTLTYYFSSFDEAIAAAKKYDLNVITFIGNSYLNSNVSIDGSLALNSEGGATLNRNADCGIIVPQGASLAISNLTVNGSGTWLDSAEPLINVEGGALTLEAAAEICRASGVNSRAACAVAVSKGGTFTMKSGSSIHDCVNSYVNVGEATGVGGGLLIDKGTAYLEGGMIYNCQAYRAGGVYIANTGVAYVSGDFKVINNKSLDGATSNVIVEDSARLYLKNILTGSIGISDGIRTPTNVAARIAYSGDVKDLTDSAACFFRDDDTSVRGVLATNASPVYVTWEAIAEIIPTLQEETVEGVKAALKKINGSGVFADEKVSAGILAADDPVAAYKAFKSWAGNVLPDGESTVATGERAWTSYMFGCTELFENEPTVTFTQASTGNGALSVSVTVKDGEDPHTVASEAVAKLFEGSNNMTDWNLELNVTDVTLGSDSTVSFTVAPKTPQSSFLIRIKW